MHKVATLGLLTGCVILVGSTYAIRKMVRGTSLRSLHWTNVIRLRLTNRRRRALNSAGTSRLERRPRSPIYSQKPQREPPIRTGTSNPTP